MISYMAYSSSLSDSSTLFVRLFRYRKTFRRRSTRKYRVALHRDSTLAFWAAWNEISWGWQSSWVAWKSAVCVFSYTVYILSIKVSTLWRIQIFTEVRRPFVQSKIGECLASQIICLSPANFGLRLNYGPGSPRAPPIVLPLLRYSDSFKRKYEAKQN